MLALALDGGSIKRVLLPSHWCCCGGVATGHVGSSVETLNPLGAVYWAINEAPPFVELHVLRTAVFVASA